MDAPISGGPEGAIEGTLSIMVGGDFKIYSQYETIFQKMGKHVVHMGEGGTGTAAKLVNQLLVGIHATAAAEALSYADSLNLSLGKEGKLLPLLEQSWGCSKVLLRIGHVLAENNGSFESKGLESSEAPLRNLVKDLKIIGKSADANHLDLRCMKVAKAVYQHYEQVSYI
jgi:3-hydroxyisobutyrate dehydrogenase-like beta-hydroxyacid dehydrogenase